MDAIHSDSPDSEILVPPAVDNSICRGPDKERKECGRPTVGVVRPSGKRSMKRFSCAGHLVYYMRVVREYAQVNRVTVTFIEWEAYVKADGTVGRRMMNPAYKMIDGELRKVG